MKSLQLAKPHLIMIVGIPGSGKTFFAEQFSETFNAPFVHLNYINQIVDDRKTAQSVWDYAVELLVLTKQTILVEGGGETNSERQFIATYARKHGYQPLFIWVQTEQTTAEARATKQNPGQSDREAMSKVDFSEAIKRFQPLSAAEKYMVISGKHTYASQAKNVLSKLATPRAEKAKLTPEKRQDDSSTHSSERRGRITIN